MNFIGSETRAQMWAVGEYTLSGQRKVSLNAGLFWFKGTDPSPGAHMTVPRGKDKNSITVGTPNINLIL